MLSHVGGLSSKTPFCFRLGGHSMLNYVGRRFSQNTFLVSFLRGPVDDLFHGFGYFSLFLLFKKHTVFLCFSRISFFNVKSMLDLLFWGPEGFN